MPAKHAPWTHSRVRLGIPFSRSYINTLSMHCLIQKEASKDDRHTGWSAQPLNWFLITGLTWAMLGHGSVRKWFVGDLSRVVEASWSRQPGSQSLFESEHSSMGIWYVRIHTARLTSLRYVVKSRSKSLSQIVRFSVRRYS